MVLETVKLKEIKPVLASYIHDALVLIDTQKAIGEEEVHDTRVLMKKSRAALKLVRPQIDSETFEKEYGSCREAGRLLADSRENSVYRKTLRNLRKGNPELFDKLSTNEKLNQIIGDNPSESTQDSAGPFTGAVELLKKSAFRLRFVTVQNNDPYLLLRELEKTFDSVSTVYIDCREKPRPAKMHRLRKRVKELLYQLYFFRPLNPQGIKNVEKKLDDLAQDLGKYNDLVQLEKVLGFRPSDQELPPEVRELAVIIKNRQDHYLADVWPAAHKLFFPGQKLASLLGFRILVA
ncbi:MAG: CHAD domain-containing protein [Bacteroidales bacterium]